MTWRGTWRGTKKGLQRGLQGGLQSGLGKGLAVVSSSGQLRSRSGLVQFNSLELDSEVGRLVFIKIYKIWQVWALNFGFDFGGFWTFVETRFGYLIQAYQ